MHLNKFKEITLDTLSNHEINWDKPKYTEVCFGIPNEEDKAYDPWQFGLDNNKHGRIHGFFINNVFYIRWIDPNHRLYELDYIEYGTFFDDHYLDLIKSNLRENGSDWAADHIEEIEKQYKSRFEIQESDNISLTEEVLEQESFIEDIKNEVCEECKNKLFN